MWTLEYPIEYVFYGIATIALWTIINLFIKVTSERTEEEIDEFEPSVPEENEIHVIKEREFQGVYATRETSGIPTNSFKELRKESAWENQAFELSTGLEDSSGAGEKVLFQGELLRYKPITGDVLEIKDCFLEKEPGRNEGEVGSMVEAEPEIKTSDCQVLLPKVWEEPTTGAELKVGDCFLEKEPGKNEVIVGPMPEAKLWVEFPDDHQEELLPKELVEEEPTTGAELGIVDRFLIKEPGRDEVEVGSMVEAKPDIKVSDCQLEELLPQELVREKPAPGVELEGENWFFVKDPQKAGVGEGLNTEVKSEGEYLESSLGEFLPKESVRVGTTIEADLELEDPHNFLEEEPRRNVDSMIPDETNPKNEGLNYNLEDDHPEGIEPEGQAEEVLKRDDARPDWFGEDDAKTEQSILLDLDRKAEILGSDLKSDMASDFEVVEAPVSQVDSVRETEMEAVREMAGNWNEDSSGYEILIGDLNPPSRYSRSEEEECHDLGDDVDRNQSSEVDVDEIPEDINNEIPDESKNLVVGVEIPRINVIDPSAQGPYEFNAEEDEILEKNDVDCFPEVEEELEKSGAKIGDVDTGENGAFQDSSSKPDLDSDGEICFSEKRERVNPEENVSKSMPSDEHHYAQTEEGPRIGNERTYPIAEALSTQAQPFQEEVESFHSDESEDLTITVERLTDTPSSDFITSPHAAEILDPHGEEKEQNILKDLDHIVDGPLDSPYYCAGAESSEEGREINRVNTERSTQEGHAAESETPVVDVFRRDRVEQPTIGSNEDVVVESAVRPLGREEAIGSVGVLEHFNGGAQHVSETADRHVVPKDSDRESRESIQRVIGLPVEGDEKSSAADAMIKAEDISIRNCSNAKKPSHQG
ncbi:uncharacterized protein [Hetaerina americana]|uniref:uncharacterized protein n=1 Tax=Hetaerina americana TaxID=62018 RepID=UPI003A7F4508